MRLTPRIIRGLAIVTLPLIAIWGTLFYFTMINEINDEADDSLEDYATLIITRCREGRVLPSLNDGSNNSYSITPVSAKEAEQHLKPTFYDEEVYIPEKMETEPARVMIQAYEDGRGGYLLIKVATPTFERDDLLETILYWTIALFLILVVTVIALATLTIRRTLRPLYQLLHWLDNYTPGNGNQPVPNNTDIKEFQQLNLAAQSAVDRSEELLERQRQFIGNASHELQTPLAVISNRIEYLIDSTNPTEEQMAELTKIESTLRQSIRLNRILLQLMRIESGEVAESESVAIASIISDAVETCNDIFADKVQQCSLEIANDLNIYINESLLRTVITNLIKNAFIHTPKGAEIAITLRGNTLTIANDGAESLDKERLFQRFYTKVSREGSTGLGLALSKSICDHYGHVLTYRFEAKKHLFAIDFNTRQRK